MKRSIIISMLVLTLVSSLSTVHIFTAANAAPGNVYDLSDVVENIGPGDETELEFRVKKVGNKTLNYGDSVGFCYKERADKNTDGHFSRSAFGIGCYGFYFYHSNGDIQVKTCDLETDATDWKRGNTVATIADGTFKTYEEIVLKTEIRSDDENIVVLSMTYSGKTITHDYAKNSSSDMLFRFGDHDVTGNLIKSLKEEEKDTEAPVITVLVDEFKVAVGAYPAEDSFTITDDSGSFETTVKWSNGALDDLGRLKAGRHYCTVTATDKSGNSSSAIIKYVVGVMRKITFEADGAEVGEVEYFLDEINDLTYPDVPQKQYYDGKWEEFTPSLTEDRTVCAVYTPTEYKAKFVADGITVAERVYTVENNKTDEPAVPEKDGYTGKWESYVLTYGDVTVNAVYVKTETGGGRESNVGGGCKSNVDGGIAVVMLGIALSAIAGKRKDGNNKIN